jgi:excinuclease ABC subunit C
MPVTEDARLAAAALPAGPGVYRFRDARNRTLYVGRAVNLRRRVASYWGDLADRAHLAPMVAQIRAVEAVSCASEHEAAWLERNLLERSIPRWNRTAGGQEVEVCIRLDCSPGSPGLSVVHGCGGTEDGSTAVGHFGPYLGGARVRLAAAGLHRIFPLGYAADHRQGTAAQMAVRLGVASADRESLARSLAAVLDRDPAAVTALRARLTERRAEAARVQAYELARRIHAELAALDWVTCPQRAASLDHDDFDVAGWAGGVLARFEVRGGRMCGWRQHTRTSAQARPFLAATPPQWREFAQRNAELAARLRQAVLAGPGAGRHNAGTRRNPPPDVVAPAASPADGCGPSAM